MPATKASKATIRWSAASITPLAKHVSEESLPKTLAMKDANLVGFSMSGGEVARYMSRYGANPATKSVLIAAVSLLSLQDASNPATLLPSIPLPWMKFVPESRRTQYFSDLGKAYTNAATWHREIS